MSRLTPAERAAEAKAKATDMAVDESMTGPPPARHT